MPRCSREQNAKIDKLETDRSVTRNSTKGNACYERCLTCEFFYAPEELRGYTKITNQEVPRFMTSLILTGKNISDEYLKQLFFHFSVK